VLQAIFFVVVPAKRNRIIFRETYRLGLKGGTQVHKRINVPMNSVAMLTHKRRAKVAV
jgi:hypothetical protein